MYVIIYVIYILLKSYKEVERIISQKEKELMVKIYKNARSLCISISLAND